MLQTDAQTNSLWDCFIDQQSCVKICLRNHKTCWRTIDKQTDRQTGCVVCCREQERISKAEAARRETERILREQQAEVDAKKADMVKRDIQREKVSHLMAPLCQLCTETAYSLTGTEHEDIRC